MEEFRCFECGSYLPIQQYKFSKGYYNTECPFCGVLLQIRENDLKEISQETVDDYFKDIARFIDKVVAKFHDLEYLTDELQEKLQAKMKIFYTREKQHVRITKNKSKR